MNIIFISDVKDYPEYLVYSCGLVWSKRKKKFIKWILHSDHKRIIVILYQKKINKCFYLSRLIAECFLGLDRDSKLDIDHKDRNPFNNDISNLRIATRSQNHANKKKKSNCSSKYKGVSWHKQNNKWRVKIKMNGKEFFLGCFKDEKKAALAYNKKSEELFGEFANPSII